MTYHRYQQCGVAVRRTKSQFPSSVKNLTANPRGSRAVSAEPFSPPTVENRTRTGVFLPTWLNRSAQLRSEISSVTSNTPCAPAPLACTTLTQVRHNALDRIPLGNTFAIEMCEQVNQVEILQEQRARCADSLGGIRVEDGSAVGGSVDRRVGELWMAHNESGSEAGGVESGELSKCMD
jgi:hypothetical protein